MATSIQQSKPLTKKPKKFDLGSNVDKEEIFTYPYLTDTKTISYIKQHGRIMIIIRGPNSTLKATLSEMIKNQYPGAQLCCADHYFSKTFSIPVRSKETLALSHIYCEKKVEAACQKDESPIIVQNTHIRKSEMQKYLDFASEYNYTVIMAITLYKFNVTPETLEMINPDGLNLRYFRIRLRQWEDVPPVFTAWFLCQSDAFYVLKLLQTSLTALLDDGKFCHVFDCSDNDEIWNYFDARQNLCSIAGFSHCKLSMKKYYLSDLVQECYGKCYCITIQGYLITTCAVMGIVHIDEDMLQLVFEEDTKENEEIHTLFSSISLNNIYNNTIPFDDMDSSYGKTVVIEDWLDDEVINPKTCRLIHLAQKKFEIFDFKEIEKEFYSIMKSIEDLSYIELEKGIQICRLPGDKWLVKLAQKVKIDTIFTGFYV